MSKLKTLTNGLIKENPVLVLVLGTCPTLAISTRASGAIGMGIAATLVLIGSNAAISAMRKIIPDKVRIPCYIVLIAGFVTIIQMLVKAFTPSLDASLGIYLPLIVVNCIIFARAESFAGKNPPLASVLDGFGMGLGFTFALTILGSLRELFGSGTLFGFDVLTRFGYEPMLLVVFAPGGFIALGLLLGAFNAIVARKKVSA